MKKFLVILIVLMSLQAALIAQTYPVVVAGNWHVYYYNQNPRQLANDFHICGIVESRNNVQPKLESHVEWCGNGNSRWYLEEFTIEKVANHATNWYFTAHFKTDGTITSGTLMHFGLNFLTNYSNKAVVNCSYFTYFKEAVGYMPLISFNITRQLGIVRAILINTAPVPLVLTNIEFAVSKKAIPLEKMFTDGLGNPGDVTIQAANTGLVSTELVWKTFSKDIVLESNTNIDMSLKEIAGIDLQADEFLLIRGYTIYQDKKLPWWLQHQDTGK